MKVQLLDFVLYFPSWPEITIANALIQAQNERFERFIVVLLIISTGTALRSLPVSPPCEIPFYHVVSV
jgi:hypothetical protein